MADDISIPAQPLYQQAVQGRHVRTYQLRLDPHDPDRLLQIQLANNPIENDQAILSAMLAEMQQPEAQE